MKCYTDFCTEFCHISYKRMSWTTVKNNNHTMPRVYQARDKTESIIFTMQGSTRNHNLGDYHTACKQRVIYFVPRGAIWQELAEKAQPNVSEEWNKCRWMYERRNAKWIPRDMLPRLVRWDQDDTKIKEVGHKMDPWRRPVLISRCLSMHQR